MDKEQRNNAALQSYDTCPLDGPYSSPQPTAKIEYIECEGCGKKVEIDDDDEMMECSACGRILCRDCIEGDICDECKDSNKW